MADKLRAQQQLEALQARYIGIGSADTTKHEWTSNIARDSLSSYLGHPPLLQYMSIGLGQSREKTRLQLLERMVRPVGPPPEVSGSGRYNIREPPWLTRCSSRMDRQWAWALRGLDSRRTHGSVGEAHGVKGE